MSKHIKEKCYNSVSHRNTQLLSTIDPTTADAQETVVNVDPNAWTPDSSQIEEDEDGTTRFVEKSVPKELFINTARKPAESSFIDTYSQGIVSTRVADGLSSSSHSQSESKRSQKMVKYAM